MKRLVLIASLAALGFAFSARHEVKENLPEKIEVRHQEVKPQLTKLETAAKTLSDPGLQDEIDRLSAKLKPFEALSYDQFSPAQLEEFAQLNFRRAALIKNRIFRKYGSKYAKTL